MAKKDPVLIKNNIQTFLISPQYYGGDFQVSNFTPQNCMFFSSFQRDCDEMYTFNFETVKIVCITSVLQSGRIESPIFIGYETNDESIHTQQCNVFTLLKLSLYYFNNKNLCKNRFHFLNFHVLKFYRENYFLTVHIETEIVSVRILCKIQWNSICKL